MPEAFQARHGLEIAAVARGLLPLEAARSLIDLLGRSPTLGRQSEISVDRHQTARDLLDGPRGILHDAALLLRFETLLSEVARVETFEAPLPLPISLARWRLARNLRAILETHLGPSLAAPPTRLLPGVRHLEACAQASLALLDLGSGRKAREGLSSVAREIETLLFAAMQRRSEAPLRVETVLEDAHLLSQHFDPVHDPRRPFRERLARAQALAALCTRGTAGELERMTLRWRDTVSELLHSAVEDARC